MENWQIWSCYYCCVFQCEGYKLQFIKGLCQLFKCSAKSKLETNVMEENGFEPNSNDAKLPAKGLEKHKSSMWRKLSICLLL